MWEECKKRQLGRSATGYRKWPSAQRVSWSAWSCLFTSPRHLYVIEASHVSAITASGILSRPAIVSKKPLVTSPLTKTPVVTPTKIASKVHSLSNSMPVKKGASTKQHSGRRREKKEKENLAWSLCRGFLSSTTQEPSWDVSGELNAWASLEMSIVISCTTPNIRTRLPPHTANDTFCLTNNYVGELRNTVFCPVCHVLKSCYTHLLGCAVLYSVVSRVDCVPPILSKFQPAMVLLSGLIFTCPVPSPAVHVAR